MVSMASSEDSSLESGRLLPSLPVAVGRMMDTFVGKVNTSGSADRLPVVEIRPFMSHEWRPSRSLPDYYDRSITSMSYSSRRSFGNSPLEPAALGLHSSSPETGCKVTLMERIEKARHKSKEGKHVESSYPGTFATPLDREKTTIEDLNAPTNPNTQYACFRRALSETDVRRQQDMRVQGRKLENMPPKLSMLYMTPWEYYHLNKSYTIPGRTGGTSAAPNTAQSGIDDFVLNGKGDLLYQAQGNVLMDDAIYDTFDRSNTLPSIQVSNVPVKKKRPASPAPSISPDSSASESPKVSAAPIYQLGVANSLDVLKNFGRPSRVETHLTMHLKNTIKHLRRTRNSQSVMIGSPANQASTKAGGIRPDPVPTFGETMIRAGIEANNSRQVSNVIQGNKRSARGPDTASKPATGRADPITGGSTQTLNAANPRDSVQKHVTEGEVEGQMCGGPTNMPGDTSPTKDEHKSDQQTCLSQSEGTSITDTNLTRKLNGTPCTPPTSWEDDDSEEGTSGRLSGECPAGSLQNLNVPVFEEVDSEDREVSPVRITPEGYRGADPEQEGRQSRSSLQENDESNKVLIVSGDVTGSLEEITDFSGILQETNGAGPLNPEYAFHSGLSHHLDEVGDGKVANVDNVPQGLVNRGNAAPVPFTESSGVYNKDRLTTLSPSGVEGGPDSQRVKCSRNGGKDDELNSHVKNVEEYGDMNGEGSQAEDEVSSVRNANTTLAENENNRKLSQGCTRDGEGEDFLKRVIRQESRTPEEGDTINANDNQTHQASESLGYNRGTMKISGKSDISPVCGDDSESEPPHIPTHVNVPSESHVQIQGTATQNSIENISDSESNPTLQANSVIGSEVSTSLAQDGATGLGPFRNGKPNHVISGRRAMTQSVAMATSQDGFDGQRAYITAWDDKKTETDAELIPKQENSQEL